jgi:hypothetical protein
MMKTTTLALFAAISLASVPALADRGDRAARHPGFVDPNYAAAHAALESRDDLLQRRSTTFRIGAVERQEIRDQRREIKRLQDRLEDGDAVDTFSIYRALDGPQHVIYFDSDLAS